MNQLYGGRYKQLERIGSGTYGVIYKVRQIEQGRLLIAKHITLQKTEMSKAMQQFQIISRLRHHYIVKYFDSFMEQDQMIIIMEYCGEKDLSWHIQQRRRTRKHFSQSMVTNWILQMLLAVGFMHANKVVHRDLKPQNVFVDTEMNLKIGDFGISRLLDSTGQHCMTTAGTPSYMAPQILDSEQYSFKADVWSLGCVIYEVCTLERLFPSKDSEDKPIGLFKFIDVVKSGQIKDIPAFYSKDLRQLVRKMLNRNPANRPKCQDLLKDKLLVQLMIKRINTSESLKQQYPKAIQPPSLSDSLLNKQTNAVKEQMQKLQSQIVMKMGALKDKRIDRKELTNYEKEIKAKMQEVEKAVKIAFQQLNKNGKFQQKQKMAEQSPKSKPITNLSIQNSKLSMNKSGVKKIESNSSSVSSLATVSRFMETSSKKKYQQSSIDLVESQMIESRVKYPQNNSNLSETIMSQMEATRRDIIKEDPFEGTIQTQFAQTNQDPNVLQATINRLELIQQTIKKHPEALLSDSFLNCTLSLTHGEELIIPKNKKLQQSMSASISFDLTKTSTPNLNKKQVLPQKEKQQKQHKVQDEYGEEYKQDFQQYEQNQQIDVRRAAQLQTMLSLYQQTLAELGKTENTSGKLRNKFLVMSEIKEQSNQGGSMISREDSL